jgi:hypothetical protein
MFVFEQMKAQNPRMANANTIDHLKQALGRI